MGISPVRVLPPEVSNQIAAGEVVENPASVVRELVDNSVDAGAKHIKVFIKDAGKGSITVSDDGTGISRSDASTAFLRHATSKIFSINDLSSIHTLGFRGEALASIASVSEVTMLTRTAEEAAATFIRLEAGQVVKQEDAARAHGTTITVDKLFANVPARLKFLKQDQTEVRHIKQTLIKVLLGHPGLQIEFVLDDVPVFRYNAVKNPLERIVQLFGSDFQEILVPVKDKTTGMSFSAWISKPQFTKTNRQFQYFFVNRRATDTNFFYPLLNNLYSRIITPGRYPMAFFFLTADPAEVDVNVHPAKREVRFKRSSEVYDFLFAAARRVLTSDEAVPQGRPIKLDMPFTPSTGEPRTAPAGMDYKERLEGSIKGYMDRNAPKLFGDMKPSVAFNRDTGTSALSGSRDQDRPNEVFTGLFGSSVIILGQLFNTYILLESGDDLYLVDQHAAHERVIFERLKREFEKRMISAQPLLIPFQAELNPVHWDTVRKNMALLHEVGYETDDFGKNTVIVRSVPSFVRRGNDKELFLDLVDLMSSDENRKLDATALTGRMLESMACHSAVRAGDRQSRDEMEALLEQVSHLDNLLHCPHGRPFIIRLSKLDIEKLFSRKF
jgi:DNA mismatch repair protein MutL